MHSQEEKGTELGKVWVLETQTKGTGANMVPLESVQQKAGSDAVPGFALPRRRLPPPSDPEPQQPHIFKVTDVMTREVLAEGVDARSAVDVLGNVRSVVDVTVSVWEPVSARWRMLTFAETKTLWEYRERLEEADTPDQVETARA